jgi:hypothetical protein
MRLLLIPLISVAVLAAADPDPAAVVVATGVQTYRVKDLDALMAIAKRHGGTTGTAAGADDERLRQAIVAGLTAREALLGALSELPLSGPARDRFVLDLLDYRAEPTRAEAVSAPALPSPAAAEPVAAEGQTGAGGHIVALPALTLPRSIDGVVWVLQAEFALRFPDAAAADRAQASAPAVRDAVMDYLQQLPAAAFTVPDRAVMKRELGALIAVHCPEAAVDPLLIPALSAAPR